MPRNYIKAMGLTPSISYAKLVIDAHVVLSILDLHI